MVVPITITLYTEAAGELTYTLHSLGGVWYKPRYTNEEEEPCYMHNNTLYVQAIVQNEPTTSWNLKGETGEK